LLLIVEKLNFIGHLNLHQCAQLCAAKLDSHRKRWCFVFRPPPPQWITTTSTSTLTRARVSAFPACTTPRFARVDASLPSFASTGTLTAAVDHDSQGGALAPLYLFAAVLAAL